MDVDTTIRVVMPQMGESVTEGTVLEWHKQEGEQVGADETLVEISTDKVDAEVPAPIAGTVVKLHAAEGDTVGVGALSLHVLHCPGHSPGSIVLVSPEQRFAIVGDVLFQGSVGRTDLPGGDGKALIRSIREKLLPLGDDVAFICGHGPTSTIGQERQTNPFLQGEALI
jgi:glyoxylase-like metal-dependent hydrolase (beta-lactamase superfamily II)